jgi:FkbM family methyltransferase
MQNGTVAVIPLKSHDLRTVALTGVYEPDVSAFARAVVRRRDTVVDVGAHIGLHTLNLAKLVGSAGTVHAFEPDPQVTRLLRQGLELSGVSARVIVHEAAVGASNGVAQLFVDRDNGLTTSTVASWANRVAGFSVPVVTLDEVLLPNVERPIGLLKIDVEGVEAAVLAGAGRLLTTFPPRAIVLELSSRVDAEPLVAELEDRGYRAWAGRQIPTYTRAGYGEPGFEYFNLCAVRLGSAKDERRCG